SLSWLSEAYLASEFLSCVPSKRMTSTSSFFTEREEKELDQAREMSDKRQHHRVLKQKLRPLEEEAMGPSPKKRYTEEMVPYKSLRATAEVTARGTAQVEMMEDDSKSPTVYLQKSDEKELEPVAGGAILPSPQGSLPGRSLHREDGDNITVAGASVSLEHPASSANARETPARASRHHEPTVDTDVNHKIKSALTTEIGCFEQQYGRIFKLLQEVQGPLEVQLHFVKFAIKEAARFERHNLIQFLDNILDKLMSDSTIRSNDLDLSK
ncbi:hypothetical protein STEG23_025246, partial [Scotinomys teguina]